jgi:sarcosine oxidase subunit gamma
VTAVLSELELDAQVSVRGEPQQGFPVEPNTTGLVDGRTVLWLGPDEWLVLRGQESDYPDAAAAVDVSANQVVLELSGEGGAAALATGCSVEVAEGRCAQTLLARAPVILFRPEADRWWILVRPSFAPYLRAWLEDALTQGGVTP